MKRLICGLSAALCACVLWADTWQDPSGNRWTYTVDGKGKATVTGLVFPGAFNGKLTIPAKINKQYPIVAMTCGMPDTAQTTLTEVVYEQEGSEIKEISDYTFMYCRRLKTVRFPPRLERIGSYAFADCDSLVPGTPEDPQNSFGFPSTLTLIDNQAFVRCRGLTTMAIPDGVKINYTVAFGMCEKLTSVRLPEGLDTIDASMFNGCVSLKSITFPMSLRNFTSPMAFHDCRNLREMRLYADAIDGSVREDIFKDLTGPGTVYLMTRNGQSGGEVFSSLTQPKRINLYGGKQLPNFKWIVQNKNLLVDASNQKDGILTYRNLTVTLPDGSQVAADTSVRTGRFVKFQPWRRPSSTTEGVNHPDGVALAEIELLKNGARDPALTDAVVHVTRIVGKAEHQPEHIIDNNMTTKWFWSTGLTRFRECEIVLDAGEGKAFAFDSYRLRLADQNGRNPAAWCLSVSDSSTGPWTLVDSRSFSDAEAVGWGNDTWTEAFDVLDIGSQKNYVQEIKETLKPTTRDTTVQVKMPSGLTEAQTSNLDSALDLFDGLVTVSEGTTVPSAIVAPYAFGISKMDWKGDRVLLTVKLLAPFYEARYVKIRPKSRPKKTDGVNWTDGVALSEVEFRLNGNRDSAMTDATVTATKEPPNTKERSEKTHDNNLWSKWYWQTEQTQFDDCELVFDAGEGKTFCFDSYRFGLADQIGRHPTSWTVSVSDSAVGPWTEVDSRSYPDATVFNWGTYKWKEFTFGNSVGLSDGTRLELLADGVVLNVPQTPMDESGQVVFTVDSKLFMAPSGGKTTRFTVRAVRSLP